MQGLREEAARGALSAPGEGTQEESRMEADGQEGLLGWQTGPRLCGLGKPLSLSGSNRR